MNTLLKHSKHTFEHSFRVGWELANFANYLGMKPKVEHFKIGILHDIGKIKIPSTILDKNGKLSKSEYIFIQKHVLYGEVIANKTYDFPSEYEKVILYHHENMDGSGYFGLKGEEIPLISRMIRIVDSYDTMVHGRTYQESKTPDSAKKELNELTNIYDERLVNSFMEYLNAEKLPLERILNK